MAQAKTRACSPQPSHQLNGIPTSSLGDVTLDAKLQNEIQIASHAISNFADFISTFQFTEEVGIDSDGVKSALIVASTAVYAAVVQIYGIFPQADSTALARQRSACKSAMLTIKEVAKMGTPCLPLALGVCVSPHSYCHRPDSDVSHASIR